MNKQKFVVGQKVTVRVTDETCLEGSVVAVGQTFFDVPMYLVRKGNKYVVAKMSKALNVLISEHYSETDIVETASLEAGILYTGFTGYIQFFEEAQAAA